MQTDHLAHLAFKDNLDLMYRGAECWASRAVAHFKELGAVGAINLNNPQIPLWQHRVSVKQLITDKNTAWWAQYLICPRTLPVQHVPGRTLYLFGTWFLQLTSKLQVHHNIQARDWKRVLRWCCGSHTLMAAQARWGRGVVARCPCCGATAEDELHLALECPEYSHIRQQHPALFQALGGPLGATSTSMQHIFQPVNFTALSAFLKACNRRRDACLEPQRN
jgi:hypothetical protein